MFRIESETLGRGLQEGEADKGDGKRCLVKTKKVD